MTNTNKVCLCGCGLEPAIAKRTNKTRGHVAGQHVRYVVGHGNRGKFKPAYVAEERGYETPCHIFQLHIGELGYGRIQRNGKLWLAHRWFYVQAKGPIPDGLTLDHLCRQRDCINPDHLEPVTYAVNQQRGTNTKLKAEQVEQILASNETGRALARRFGVSDASISLIRRGHRWCNIQPS